MKMQAVLRPKAVLILMEMQGATLSVLNAMIKLTHHGSFWI